MVKNGGGKNGSEKSYNFCDIKDYCVVLTVTQFFSTKKPQNLLASDFRSMA
jgi:hypothetical protein